MVNIDEFTKQTGKFLKADDVIAAENKSFVINGESAIVPNEKFGGEKLEVPGTFDGESKVFSCSKTNARAIDEILGSETSKWLGAILTLETYRTKLNDGRMVDAINVKEIKKLGSVEAISTAKDPVTKDPVAKDPAPPAPTA